MSSNVSFTVRPPPRTFETDTPEPSRPGSASPSDSDALPRARPKKRQWESYTANDSSDEDEHDTKEMITGFDAMGVQRSDGKSSKPAGPLIIPAQKNRDWRAESMARKRHQMYVPEGAKVGTGVDGSQGGLGTRGKINDGPQLSGLIVTKVKQEDGEDIKMEEVDVEVKEEQDEPAKEEEPMDEDQRALRALLRGEQGNEVKREIAAISVQDQPGGWAQPKTEADAFKEDLATRPDEASLDDYDRVPIELFGEAMLRGMGMGRPSKKAIQPYIPEARPALLGIGAKPRPVDEVDQGKGKKFARPDKRYVPILKVERNGSGQTERTGIDAIGIMIVETETGIVIMTETSVGTETMIVTRGETMTVTAIATEKRGGIVTTTRRGGGITMIGTGGGMTIGTEDGIGIGMIGGIGTGTGGADRGGIARTVLLRINTHSSRGISAHAPSHVCLLARHSINGPKLLGYPLCALESFHMPRFWPRSIDIIHDHPTSVRLRSYITIVSVRFRNPHPDLETRTMSLSAAAISKNYDALAQLISSWVEANPPNKDREVSEECKERAVTIALRTRPFLKSEGEGLLSGIHARGKNMWVHVPSSKLVQWSGPTIQHKPFEGDFAFGPESASEEVYDLEVDNRHGAWRGSRMYPCVSNLQTRSRLVYKLVQLRYGQTGSGKTYTISSLEEIVSHDIFPAAESYASTHFANFPTAPRDVFAVGISMYELLGNKVTDLLDRDSPEVDIAEDKFGGIKVSAKVIPVTDAEELAKMIATAVSHRRTSTTLKNETSSRSHCVLNIIVTNTLVPAVEPGRLVLVDLAGSERAADRTAHTKELMNEARLINTSLMALKDCVRGRALVESERSKRGDGNAGFQHIPYRRVVAHTCAEVKKPVFDVEATRHSRTVIIAHVSPHLADASHSSNTLTYIAPFRVTATSQSAASSTTSPATWSNEAFRTWVTKTSSKIDSEKLVPFESGKQMCELEESVFIQRCLDSQKDGLDKPLTEAGAKSFYDKLWGMVGKYFSPVIEVGCIPIIEIVEAKRNSRPEELRTLMYNPPSTWSHFQARDYIEKELPSVDLDKLMPTMAPNPRRGKDFINGMGEAEFILTVTSSNKDGEAVSIEHAKDDTWNASRTEALTQRDPNGGNGAYDAFNEERLNDPAIYALVYGSQPPPLARRF
ncbi:diatom spindle kinesin 1 [Rhizoctonia solani AG-1 IA]|uniref:Diatom spindle kinesin 1 n=1 Tax=Thanatephorus cucumeris (strain AG1-IA) TaxID=983506 RepID=L8WZ49_THACA|nr:diatom spindle kinesin 1 [Rhizoctonia solani AG-1 IA]